MGVDDIAAEIRSPLDEVAHAIDVLADPKIGWILKNGGATSKSQNTTSKSQNAGSGATSKSPLQHNTKQYKNNNNADTSHASDVEGPKLSAEQQRGVVVLLEAGIKRRTAMSLSKSYTLARIQEVCDEADRQGKGTGWIIDALEGEWQFGQRQQKKPPPPNAKVAPMGSSTLCGYVYPPGCGYVERYDRERALGRECPERSDDGRIMYVPFEDSGQPEKPGAESEVTAMDEEV
jgi:hypothetical protein